MPLSATCPASIDLGIVLCGREAEGHVRLLVAMCEEEHRGRKNRYRRSGCAYAIWKSLHARSMPCNSIARSHQVFIGLLLSLDCPKPFVNASHCPNERSKNDQRCPWSFYAPQYHGNIRAIPCPSSYVTKEGVFFGIEDLW
jgi:hypothetical protein